VQGFEGTNTLGNKPVPSSFKLASVVGAIVERQLAFLQADFLHWQINPYAVFK